MNIVFMGSTEFGLPSLAELIKHHTLVGVVSTPPKPQGRGLQLADSPITTAARAGSNVPVITPERLRDNLPLVEELRKLNADAFVVVAFRILPFEIFSLPRLGTINVHASLLPRFRGPAPIQRAIESGEKSTGITIFRIDAGIDTGEILLQQELEIGASETTPELYSRLSIAGAGALIEALAMLESGTYAPKPQNIALATKAPKLTKEEALIEWHLAAGDIFNKIRAFKPFPGTYTVLFGKRLGIVWAEPVRSGGGEPGLIDLVSTDYIEVLCGSGRLRILEVKPEGRRSMKVHDFLLGTRIKEGMKLGLQGPDLPGNYHPGIL